MSIIKVEFYEVLGGSSLNDVADEMCEIARQTRSIVKLKFNGIDLKAYYFSEQHEIVEQYHLGLKSKEVKK